MMVNRIVALLLSIVVAGCAAGTSEPRSHANHPANPSAPEAPVHTQLARLSPDDFDNMFVGVVGGAGESPAAPAPAEGDSMLMHHHQGMTPAGEPGPTAPREPARRDSMRTHVLEAERAVYVCPMHPVVTDTTASKCPKCGMTLVRQKEKP